MSCSNNINTDLLIVGAGPAGASLACFLARYNLSGLVISKGPGTASTPRAHIHNMAAFETLRDIGLYEECLRVGNSGDTIMHYRWAETMAGQEYARSYSWGNGPRKSDYRMVSPCKHMDLPQSVLEPILVQYATNNGFKLRFDTELLSFETNGEKTKCTVKDCLANTRYTITTRFLFGADGARSIVQRDLGLPMTVLPGGGLAFNVLYRADLSYLMPSRHGNLHWCLRMEKDYPFMCVNRMVKPWHEWMFVFFPKGPDAPNPDRSEKEWKHIIEDCLGSEDVNVEILDVSKWMINETSADVTSKGNIFCLGDAIHRHPPTMGLGSNTAIQDSFNLAWKVNLVLKGLASPSLLHTYDVERQPIAQQLVKASNDILRKHILIWQAMGCMPYGTSEPERLRGIKELQSSSEEGSARRRLLKQRIDEMQHETHALGIEMGQLYHSSAVCKGNEEEEFQPQGREALDPILYYEPCTYPGRRLPHVWLGTRISGSLISTLDVAGRGLFTVFIGIGGENWDQAARRVMKEVGIDIRIAAVGRGLEWEDTYLEWDDKKGVEDDGCVLVRPDFFVAWRSKKGDNVERCFEKLRKALIGVLGLGDNH